MMQCGWKIHTMFCHQFLLQVTSQLFTLTQLTTQVQVQQQTNIIGKHITHQVTVLLCLTKHNQQKITYHTSQQCHLAWTNITLQLLHIHTQVSLKVAYCMVLVWLTKQVQQILKSNLSQMAEMSLSLLHIQIISHTLRLFLQLHQMVHI